MRRTKAIHRFDPETGRQAWTTVDAPPAVQLNPHDATASYHFDPATGHQSYMTVDASGRVSHTPEDFQAVRRVARAQYFRRKRREAGQKVAPPPVSRPLVLAAPRERRESHRRARRTGDARGDPDLDDPEIDRRYGAAFLTGQNAALGVSRRDFACWYDHHTSRLDGRPSDPANFEPTWTRAE